MKTTILIVYFIIVCLSGSIVSSQQVYFNKRLNLSSSDAFYSATSVLQHNYKYYITGATEDTNNQNWRWVFFTEISDTGAVNFTKFIGNNSNNYYPAWPGSFKVHNNNFFFAGNKAYFGPYHPAGLLTKMTELLDTIWSIEYLADSTLPYDSSQIMNNMDISVDGGFIFTGELYFGQQPSQMVLLRADSSGHQQWVKYFGTIGLNAGYSVIQTTDGGFAIGGFWYVPGSSVYTGDPIVIKTDSLGNKQWDKNLGGPYQDNSATLCLDPEGGIIAGTMFADSMGGDDPYSRIQITKLDNSGSIIWDKKYGKSDVKYNYLTNIRCLDDGSIIACGFRPTNYPHRSGWLLKVTPEGDSMWYREYNHLYGYYSENQLKDVIPTADNGFLACGTVVPRPPDTGTQDAWVLKLDSMGCDTPGCATGVGIVDAPRLTPQASGFYIFPNPATSEIQLRFSLLDTRSSIFIYDLFGRKQDEIIIPKGQEQTRVDVSSYPDGVYIVVLKSEDGNLIRGKFIKSGDR